MKLLPLVLKFVLALALTAAIREARCQVLQFQPLSTFGTNGNGSILPFERTYLTSGNNRYQRGMAYNPATGHLLIASHALIDTNSATTNVAPYIAIIDAASGADLGSLDLSSLSIGADSGFDINMIAVADDGSIYASDMSSKTTSTGDYNLYRWADESSPQTIVYFGDPSNSGDGNAINNRWGDTLAVMGSGINTKVLISSRGTEVALLTPNDPSFASFSATTLHTDVPAGELGYGLSFGLGASNTFWAKAAPGSLYLLSYDPVAATATTLQKYSTSVFPTWTGVLSIQSSNNLLATLEMPPTGPANIRLYDISNPANPPVLLDRKAWITNESNNGIFAGSIAFAGTNVYALNSDNGIMAFSIVSGPAPQIGAAVILNPLSGTASLANNAAPFVGAADGGAPLSYQWYFNTNTVISKATNATFTVTNVQPASFGNYYFIVSNSYGSATSAVATLTEAVTFKNGVIYEPFNYSAGLPLQNLGGWVTNTASVQAQVQGCYIAPGSLTGPGLTAPAGNHYLWASNVTVRLPFGTQTNGPIYFSFAHRGTNINANTATEDPIGGLAYFSSTTLYPKIDCVWSDANHYTLGIAKGTGVAFRTTDTNVITGTDTVFIVCCFMMTNGNIGSDIAQLWVNPDPATFGAAVPPAPNCSTNLGNGGASADPATGVDRISWRGTAASFQHEVDELRIGFTWAAVTPPPMYLSAANNGGAVVISWPTNAVNWTLVSTTNLTSGVWTTNTPIVPQGSNNTYTVSAPAAQEFYRLVH
jgi:hypothetical protein